MADSAILRGNGLNLSFGGLSAIVNLTFEVRRGTILSVIGPNGSGKTSLINCVNGFYRPQRGNLYFDGREIIRLAPHKIARLGIGRTFQNLALYPEMTVLDNLMLARYMHTKAGLVESVLPFGKAHREEIANRYIVEQVITFVGLEDSRKKPVSALPYGLRKLVEIARALCSEPKLMLIDEPTSGLDALTKRRVAKIIFELQKLRNVTILLIEHDMRFVMDLSEWIIALDHGEKIAEGTPSQISNDSRVIEAYLGEESLREVA